jgi:hypothetical protein
MTRPIEADVPARKRELSSQLLPTKTHAPVGASSRLLHFAAAFVAGT